MTEEGKTAEGVHSEIAYLWDALEKAQESEGRAKMEFEKIAGNYRRAESRIKHLETSLAQKENAAAELRRNIEELENVIKENAETARKAADLWRNLADYQSRTEKLHAKIAALSREKELDAAKIKQLQSQIRAQNTHLRQKDELARNLEAEIAGLSRLPEMAQLLDGEKAPGLLRALSRKLEKTAAQAREYRSLLEKTRAENALLAKKTEASGRDLDSLAERLRVTEARLREREGENEKLRLETARAAKDKEDALSSLASLRGEFKELAREKANLGEKISAASEKLAQKDKKIFSLETSTREMQAGIIAEKGNFADAVKKIFSLQTKVNELKRKLLESAENAKNAGEELGAKRLEFEKVQMLLRETSLNLRNQKEINLKLVNKADNLRQEVKELAERASKEADYSKEMFKRLNEKQSNVDFLKKQLEKMNSLERELIEEKRKNVRTTSMIKREQTDFMDKIIASIEKVGMDVKLLHSRIAPSARRMLAGYLKNLSQVANLLKGWRQYVDQDTPELEYVNIREILEPMLAQWEKTFRLKRLKLIKRIGVDSRCKINREKMRFAFYQIIKNSYEELITGGSLTVSTGISEDRKYAIVKLEDTSRGLPQAVVENLYSPFNTQKADRVGIGLSVAKKIAEAHGGDFFISNRRERGATAQFAIPVAQDEGEPKFEEEKEDKKKEK